MSTIMILNFRTDRSWQTVKTQIRLLQEEQSDQSLHCLLFHLHRFDEISFTFETFIIPNFLLDHLGLLILPTFLEILCRPKTS